MRPLVSFVGLGLTALAVTVFVPEAPAAAGDPPLAALKITNVKVKRATMNGAPMRYSAGPLDYEIEVSNSGTTRVSTSLRIAHGAGTPSQSMIVAPPGKATFVVTDTTGIERCGATFLKIGFGPDLASGVKAQTAGNCAVSGTVVDPDEGVGAGTVMERRTDKLYFYAMKPVPDLTCRSPVNFIANVANNAKIAAKAEITVKPPVGATAEGQKLVFDLAPGETKRVTNFGLSVFDGDQGFYTVEVRDMNGKVPVYSPGLGVKVARTCQPEVERFQ